MRKILYILSIAITIASCNSAKQPIEFKKEIAVSILPQKYFLEKIAGDNFSVNVMIPPGASPATYEPTPAQLASISKTSLYLMMGYTGFEMAWMEKLASSNSEMNIVNLSEGVDLIMEENAHDNPHHDHGHGGIDPHTWLSPKNAKIISQNTYKALSATYPELENTFKTNLEKLITEIDSLDNYISALLTNLSSRAFFTYHPSLSYFARDYNLEQSPLELGGKTPSAAHMKNLVDKGQEKNIGVIFLQMQFDQKNAEVLANEIDAEIIQINPLDEEWFKQMIFIADKLKENLK